MSLAQTLLTQGKTLNLNSNCHNCSCCWGLRPSQFFSQIPLTANSVISSPAWGSWARGEESVGKAEGLMSASATIRAAASQRRALAPEAFQSSSARSPDVEAPAPSAYPSNTYSFSISKLAIGNIVGCTGS
ncbi:hypothetical protein AAFF_G00289780 [Aldrovandia affinis]|uniref:Uncharacterized protein n=1 Tax=Aldrovandia affinis TaxID=143900 RepID=A0AAD7R9M1_9TELE|nr:hypothetical protein AAFF_G00289780 [Aldrovandia affinis]